MTVSPETGYPAGLTGLPHSDPSSPLGRRNPVWCYKTWTYAQPHRARRALPRAHQHKRNAPYTHPDAPRVTAGLTQVSPTRTDAAMRCHHLDAAQAGRRPRPFPRGHVKRAGAGRRGFQPTARARHRSADEAAVAALAPWRETTGEAPFAELVSDLRRIAPPWPHPPCLGGAPCRPGGRPAAPDPPQRRRTNRRCAPAPGGALRR